MALPNPALIPKHESMKDPQDRRSPLAGGSNLMFQHQAHGPTQNKSPPISEPELPSWFVSMGESYNAAAPAQISHGRVSNFVPQTPSPTPMGCEPGNQVRSKTPENAFRYKEMVPLERPNLAAATAKLRQAGSNDTVDDLDTEWLKITEEDSAVTIPHIGLGSSFITLGAGLDVRSLKCGFDTCLVEMKNLPLDVTPKEIETLLSAQGVRSRTFRAMGTQQYGDGTIRLSILSQKDAAKQLADKLDGLAFKGRKIEFNVVGHNSLPAIQSVRPNILTLSWEAPEAQAMVALLSYHNPQQAHNFVQHLNKNGLEGHPLRAHVVMHGPDSQGGVTLVKTNILPNGINPFQLYSRSKAQSILIQPDDSNRVVISSIIQHLGNPPQTLNRTISCAGKMFGLLNVTLSSWQSVKQACESLSGQRLNPDHPVLRCYLPFCRPVRYAVYLPLEHQYMHYWKSVAERHRNELAITSMHSNHGCIPPVDEKAGDGRLIVRVENLRLDKTQTPSFWVWACSSAATLHEIQTRLGISLIELSWATRTLRLFAESQGTLNVAIQMIKMDMIKSSLVQRVITTDRRLIRSLQTSGALATLRQRFGVAGHVILDMSSTHCTLKHRMPCSQAALDLLAKHKGQIENYHRSMWLDEIDVSCPICLDDFSEPNTPIQRLTCGHMYCSTCLHQFLVTAPERNKYPLVCIGNEDRCGTMIPIPIIQSLLSPQEFDSLVEKALSSYVGKNNEQYKYCPTPTCTQLYRVSTETGRPGVVLTATCPSCTLELCTACHKPTHPGMTCAERRAQEPSENDALNTQWASTNGAKKCPTCSVWIQKTEGCNHVRCRCGAHMCWICGRAFEGGNETYRHLRAAHGVGAVFANMDAAGNLVAQQAGAGGAGGGAGGRDDEVFFGAPPGPGEILIGPGGIVLAVGPGVNPGILPQVRLGRAANEPGAGAGGAVAGAGGANAPFAPPAFNGAPPLFGPGPGPVRININFGRPDNNRINPMFIVPPGPNAVQR